MYYSIFLKYVFDGITFYHIRLKIPGLIKKYSYVSYYNTYTDIPLLSLRTFFELQHNQASKLLWSSFTDYLICYLATVGISSSSMTITYNCPPRLIYVVNQKTTREQFRIHIIASLGFLLLNNEFEI